MNQFDEGLFKQRICSLFIPECSAGDISELIKSPGSTVVNFTIAFRHGGPTVRHMRTQLVDPILVQDALDPDFTLATPYRPHLVEDTEHFSNAALLLRLNAVKGLQATPILGTLLSMWGLVVFWTITSRGDRCRKRAHSEWRANFVPSAETLQIFVISSFVQLILLLGLHYSSQDVDLYISYGLLSGCVGVVFTSLLNSWIRGESVSLRNALSVDKIDKQVPGWQDDVESAREYRLVYEPGGDRTLGALAAQDWESAHLEMEKRMGLLDLSEQVFDEIQPDKDPSVLAAFLNGSLFGAFSGKKADVAAQGKPLPMPSELMVVNVEVPAGLPKSLLCDAMMQWRLRHTAHPKEARAVDWLLGQLDPASFDLCAVKVPEQARTLVLEALIQHAQQHADLQVDAGYALTVQQTMQQLSPRFEGLEVNLPDDGKGTEKVRELVVSALRARVEKPGKRDITQEEGLLLQYAMSMLGEASSLITMPHVKGGSFDDRSSALKAEIEGRADALRAGTDEYLYDDELFQKVYVVSRNKPPDHVEQVAARGPNAAGRRRSVTRQAAMTAPAAAPAAAAPLSMASPPALTPPSLPASPPESPPASPPGASDDTKQSQDTQGSGIKSSGLLSLWWRAKRRRETRDHAQMPCWKQYFVLFIGTIVIAVCSVATTTLFVLIPPLIQYFVLFSLCISIPFSVIVHFMLRTFIRWLRKYLALRRGKMIEGAFTHRQRKQMRKASLAPASKKQGMEDKAALHSETSTNGVALHSETSTNGVAEQSRYSEIMGRQSRSYSLSLQRETSAILTSQLVDAAPSLAGRRSSCDGKRIEGVMTRNSGADGEPGRSTSAFLEEASATTKRAMTFRPGTDKAKSRDAAIGRAEQILSMQTRRGSREERTPPQAAAPSDDLLAV